MIDWYVSERQARIGIQQYQNRMELTDEQLDRGGNALVAVVCFLLILAGLAAAALVILRVIA